VRPLLSSLLSLRKVLGPLMPLPSTHPPLASSARAPAEFVKGFGGIGGLLRYKVDFAEIADALEQGDDDEFFDSDEEFI